MMIEASKLIKMPVAAKDTLSKIGTISQIVVDPENGRLMGFLVSTGFFSSQKALSVTDIKFWDVNGIVIAAEDHLVEPEEIIRIKHILDKNINLMNMGTKTENGKSLGVVEDFLIDTETEMVIKYYLRDILGKARIMPSDKVIKIDKEIVFSDDEEGIKSGVPKIQTA